MSLRFAVDVKFLQFLKRGRNKFKSGFPHAANRSFELSKLNRSLFCAIATQENREVSPVLAISVRLKTTPSIFKAYFFPAFKAFQCVTGFLGNIASLHLLSFRSFFLVSITIFQSIQPLISS